jgi:hypothetical protein
MEFFVFMLSARMLRNFRGICWDVCGIVCYSFVLVVNNRNSVLIVDKRFSRVLGRLSKYLKVLIFSASNPLDICTIYVEKLIIVVSGLVWLSSEILEFSSKRFGSYKPTKMEFFKIVHV